MILKFLTFFLMIDSLALAGTVSCSSVLGLSSAELHQAEGVLRDYTRSGYLEINKEIRNSPTSEDSRHFLRMLNLALDQIPDFEGYVYRGIKSDEASQAWIDSLNKGDEFSWSTPISTSSKQRIGRVFGPIVFTIKARTAKDVQDYAIYSGVGINEYEYLLRPGTRFRVVSIIMPYPGKINREVYVEEI